MTAPFIPRNIDEFVQLIGKSGLLNDQTVQSALNQFRQAYNVHQEQEDSFVKFTFYLTSHEYLTRWQCDRLLEGKWKGFFLDNFVILDYVDSDDTTSQFRAEDRDTRKKVFLRITPPRIIPPKNGKLYYTVEKYHS